MNTTIESAAPAEEVTPRITPRRSRIDPSHELATEVAPPVAGLVPLEPIEEPTEELLAAVTGRSPEARRQQLELQAEQLSEHLRERLRDVDRREAQLNARVAQLESDLRCSRVWLREQEHDFAEREAQLRLQLDDARAMGEGRTEATDGAGDLEAARLELSRRGQQLALKENELRERRFETEREASALRHAHQLWEQEKARQEAELARERSRMGRQLRDETDQRDQQLRAAEELVAREYQQLARDREDLATDRQAWEERRRVQAEALDARGKAADAELADHRLRLDARAEWIERQRSGLEQVRDEISTLHRQSLEMRLIAEQLWSQISGRMSPAEITQSIALMRRKLAEHYRLEEQALASQKEELLGLGQRITNQHRELTQLQSGLKDWLAARQAEIEQQAADLVRREQELDSQEEQYRVARGQWLTERQSLEQQLRELRALARVTPAA